MGKKEKKEKIPLTKEQKRKSIIGSSICCVVAASLGIGLGVYFGLQNRPSATSSVDPLLLEDDNTRLLSKYQSAKNSNKDMLNSFTPVELANIGILSYGEKDYTHSEALGAVLASGVNQSVRSYSVKTGTTQFNESISASSMVQVAKRFYKDDAGISLYVGSGVTEGRKATYPETASTVYDADTFVKTWGRDFSRPLIYIISTKTVLESSSAKEEGGYSVTLELDPLKSVVRYKKQMKEMSSLSQEPTFYSVKLTLSMDESMVLRKMEVLETYDVTVVIPFKATATLTEDYYVDDSPSSYPSAVEDVIYQ